MPRYLVAAQATADLDEIWDYLDTEAGEAVADAETDRFHAQFRTLAARAPLALGSAKLVINQCVNVDTETGRNFERIAQSVLKMTSDHQEGAQSFIEKRKPEFTGR